MKYIIMCVILMNLIIFMLIWLNNKMKYNHTSLINKMTPFECGFNPMSSRPLPFSNQFFMTSLMFLVFDVEVSILLSMIPATYLSSIYWLFIIIVFISLLMVGLMLEWWMNSMKWNK